MNHDEGFAGLPEHLQGFAGTPEPAAAGVRRSPQEEPHPYAEGTLLRALHDVKVRDCVIDYSLNENAKLRKLAATEQETAP